MSYDLYPSTRLFAVADKWNTNLPYVANIKINNTAKGTKSYSDSVIHIIAEEIHCLMQKKVWKFKLWETHVILKNRNQGKIRIFGITHKIQGWMVWHNCHL